METWILQHDLNFAIESKKSGNKWFTSPLGITVPIDDAINTLESMKKLYEESENEEPDFIE